MSGSRKRDKGPRFLSGTWRTHGKKQNKDVYSSVQDIETKLEALTNDNEKLRNTLEVCKSDFSEVADHLKTTIERKDDEVANLEDQLRRERAEWEFEGKSRKMAFQINIDGLEKSLEHLKAEYGLLETQLKEARNRVSDRSELETKIENLEQKLKVKENEWSDRVLEAERVGVRERDRQKEELTLNFNALLRQIQEEAFSQIQGEAKRIFEENKSLSEKVAELETRETALLQKNDHLSSRVKTLRKQQIDDKLSAEHIKSEHQKEINELVKTIASLKKDLRYSEAKYLAIIEEKEFEVRNMRKEITDLENENSELKTELTNYKSSLLQKRQINGVVEKNGIDKKLKELRAIVSGVINRPDSNEEERKIVFFKLADVLGLH